MRVLVTGGAGFIGGRLAAALAERGYDVRVLDDLSAGERDRVPAGVALQVMDAADEAAPDWIAALRPAAVFHLAAQTAVGTSMARPSDDARRNVLATVRVLEGCARAGSRFILASTSGVYGGLTGRRAFTERSRLRPASAYATSKQVAELYTERFREWYGLSAAVLRYANVYGPGQTARGEGGVVACFRAQLAAGGPLVIHGDGLQSRDFIHVDDVVAANVAALEHGAEGVYNVGTGAATTVLALADLLERASGVRAGRAHAPARPGDVRHSRLSAALARRSWGWRPRYSLASGLASLED